MCISLCLVIVAGITYEVIFPETLTYDEIVGISAAALALAIYLLARVFPKLTSLKKEQQRLEDLKMTYGWDDSFNDGRSVLYSHTGLINGNPFVICRTKKMEMGTKTYYGYKTITWTTEEHESDGSS